VVDPFDTLAEEHRAAERLLTRFETSGDEALAVEVADLLRAHATTETRVVVPELRRFVDGGDDLADDIAPDLEELAALTGTVRDADQGDLAPLVERLHALTRRHAERMEREVFPAMRDAGVDTGALARALDDAGR
jgi:hypothetical protein